MEVKMTQVWAQDSQYLWQTNSETSVQTRLQKHKQPGGTIRNIDGVENNQIAQNYGRQPENH